jgi:hypothetical protein
MMNFDFVLKNQFNPLVICYFVLHHNLNDTGSLFTL